MIFLFLSIMGLTLYGCVWTWFHQIGSLCVSVTFCFSTHYWIHCQNQTAIAKSLVVPKKGIRTFLRIEPIISLHKIDKKCTHSMWHKIERPSPTPIPSLNFWIREHLLNSFCLVSFTLYFLHVRVSYYYNSSLNKSSLVI